jgi:hypothetical protein
VEKAAHIIDSALRAARLACVVDLAQSCAVRRIVSGVNGFSEMDLIRSQSRGISGTYRSDIDAFAEEVDPFELVAHGGGEAALQIPHYAQHDWLAWLTWLNPVQYVESSAA